MSFSEGELRDRVGERWGAVEVLLGLWERYGRSMNLSGARGRSALIAHCGEAWLAVEVLRKCANSAGKEELSGVDVGAGGGFPGLLLAAGLGWPLTLVEPRQKRASFLELALASIGRPDVEVCRARLHANGVWTTLAGSEPAPRFDYASSRATFDPEDWLRMGRGVVRGGGWVLVHGVGGSVASGPLMRCEGGWRVVAVPV